MILSFTEGTNQEYSTNEDDLPLSEVSGYITP